MRIKIRIQQFYDLFITMTLQLCYFEKNVINIIACEFYTIRMRTQFLNPKCSLHALYLRLLLMFACNVVMGILYRAQEPKAPVTYCDHALSGVRRPSSVVRHPSSVVRLSSVCRPLDYLHFRLLLQNRLMDFDETWYG